MRLVIGAKVRADLVMAHTVPQLDAKKWRNSVSFVPISSVCCTCVPGLLPLLRTRARTHLFADARGFSGQFAAVAAHPDIVPAEHADRREKDGRVEQLLPDALDRVGDFSGET